MTDNVGVGTDSKNQVRFIKVVSVTIFGTHYRKIKSKNVEAFSAALKRGLNCWQVSDEEREYILKSILDDNSHPWHVMKDFTCFVDGNSGREQLFVKLHDAVEFNGVLYIKP